VWAINALEALNSPCISRVAYPEIRLANFSALLIKTPPPSLETTQPHLSNLSSQISSSITSKLIANRAQIFQNHETLVLEYSSITIALFNQAQDLLAMP
jgi:hypothetical protein